MTYNGNGASLDPSGPNLPSQRVNGENSGFAAGEASHDRSYDRYGFSDRRRPPEPDRQGASFAREPSGLSEMVNYTAILRTLWRRKWLLLSIFVLGIGGATAIIAWMPAHYVAHAFVAIGDPMGKSRLSLGTNQASAGAPLPDTGAVQTEVEILKSPQLALDVIRDLNLESDPLFKPAALRAEQPTAWSRVKDWLSGSSASDPHNDADSELSQTVDNFLGRLRVSIQNSSRMVDVAFDSPDPRLSMQIANALVDRYVNKQLESSLQSAQRTSAWLRVKITRLQDKVEDGERAVEQFRSQAGLFSAPDRTPLLLKQMTDVSTELANAQTARAAVEARLSQLRTSVQGGGSGPTSDIADSPFMRTLDGQQADAEQRLAEASTSFGQKHPALTGLKERLRNIQVAKRNESTRIVASLEQDLKVGRRKERDLTERLNRMQQDIAEMNRSEIKLRALEREAQADRLVLTNFIGRFKETSQEGDTASQRPDAQIVSYAQLPSKPERPKRGLLIVIAGLASLVAGALVVLLVEKADRRLHGLEDVEGRLKLTGLGMLPFSKAARLSPSEAARYGSSYREAAKATFSRIFLARFAPKVTLVTSALPEEGKTTLALSFAAMAAQSGQRVILVDADFWKAGAGAALGIHARPGLAELLEGKAKLADAIVSDITSGADIMPAGTFSRASLLAWICKLPDLLDTLRSRYDVVIVDAPPLLAVSEAALLASHADATVLAVRWDSTSAEAVNTALKKLRDANAAVAGAVLTMVREKQAPKYGYTEAAYFSQGLASERPMGRLFQRSAELGRMPRPFDPAPSSHSNAGSRYALLLVDVGEAFTDSQRFSPTPNARDYLIRQINGLSRAASKCGITVLCSNAAREGIFASFLSRLFAINSKRKGAMHSQSEMRLEIASKDIFSKRSGDAFSNGELHDFLRDKGVTHLFLAGMDSAMSIKQTAHSALDLGYRVTFIQDGIFTAYKSRWERVLKDFESAAAFAIKSEEFAEFAMAIQGANEAQQGLDEEDPASPRSARATSDEQRSPA